jgi:hypothetical protein
MLTALERAAIAALAPGAISYTPGSWDKRFARDVSSAARDPTWEPTDNQLVQVRRVAHRYRRQSQRAHSALCTACSTPAANGATSCSCPSWRFQKTDPTTRSCKHIRKVAAVAPQPEYAF